MKEEESLKLQGKSETNVEPKIKANQQKEVYPLNSPNGEGDNGNIQSEDKKEQVVDDVKAVPAKQQEHIVKAKETGHQPIAHTDHLDVDVDSDSKLTENSKEQNASTEAVSVSSDLSDTETDQPEQKFNESGVDETSRDERDEISEIENFDLSSCGEDSLEAMYYVIRKNEILLDRMHKTGQRESLDDIKPVFPEKSTEDLNTVVYEVAGKNILKSQESADSFSDDVILKNISYGSDSLNKFLEKEWIDEEEDNLINKQAGAVGNGGETSEEEFINPILASMRKNDNLLNEMHAKAYSVNHLESTGSKLSVDEHEDDTFSELPVDDMKFGNIQRKILASSISEADSDYSERMERPNRLVKDDFNISTAFDYLPGSTDSESTIESAATKIQAGARGFLTRRRLRKSTSVSAEKHSSIGNAAIDKSLDDLVKQLEQSELDASLDEGSGENADVLGITEIKFEQRYAFITTDETTEVTVFEEQYDNIIVSRNSEDQQRSDSMDVVMHDQFLLPTPQPEEFGTAQRRMTLQRGDALQRNSTPEEIGSRQNSTKGSGHDAVDEEPDMESTAVEAVNTDGKKAEMAINPEAATTSKASVDKDAPNKGKCRAANQYSTPHKHSG